MQEKPTRQFNGLEDKQIVNIFLNGHKIEDLPAKMKLTKEQVNVLLKGRKNLAESLIAMEPLSRETVVKLYNRNVTLERITEELDGDQDSALRLFNDCKSLADALKAYTVEQITEGFARVNNSENGFELKKQAERTKIIKLSLDALKELQKDGDTTGLPKHPGGLIL